MGSRQIRLDVGGQIFKTSELTLKKVDGSILKTLVEDRWAANKDGEKGEVPEIFIDRDPTHFRKILNFLRDGQIAIPESKTEVDELRREAEFYGIDELASLCAVKETKLEVQKAEKVTVTVFSKGDMVQWRPDEILANANLFSKAWLIRSKYLVSWIETSGDVQYLNYVEHLQSRCTVCCATYKTAISYPLKDDGTHKDVVTTVKLQMKLMIGKVEAVSNTCCDVNWGHHIMHLPKSLLRHVTIESSN